MITPCFNWFTSVMLICVRLWLVSIQIPKFSLSMELSLADSERSKMVAFPPTATMLPTGTVSGSSTEFENRSGFICSRIKTVILMFLVKCMAAVTRLSKRHACANRWRWDYVELYWGREEKLKGREKDVWIWSWRTCYAEKRSWKKIRDLWWFTQ